ncbi:Arc family DNA-binding protein [Rhizobium leguminosarum]|uniref:Arc family DNA-binding protein n=1 Tax=Rhizobium ruizarguesonis TaxID=2081791 RepID=UPI00102F5FF1|nr:Arc family DNA-binding protein [Rhizobium ruizarguesonis]NEJ20275.1 Arc family DNA-binding protein [Rhizobium leguminosarum]TBA09124.1 Arc family DNA-binding protein [Rhizobium ruizarguesonis]TBB62037.1 Arc family DNA-binding protein [Rhizobium ruizarguesonis]TBB81126.1 Arc family DNA-binding protein [Rhizobium ruizarguesonis]TBC26145.1 Arc family DNA-binding protein [Rhizobium ruizarguesonis]
MSRGDPHFRLRIPEDLKREIETAARANSRTITSEVVYRLEQSFARSPTNKGGLVEEIEAIRVRLAYVQDLLQKQELSTSSQKHENPKET